MSNIELAFLLTTLAGLSTLIGAIPVVFIKKHSEKLIVGSLSFAAGVMITISIIHLLPEGIVYLNDKFHIIPTIIISIIAFILGLIFSFLIDKHLPENLGENKLYRVGIFSMLAIILHNIPEGIATFLTTAEDLTLGLPLGIAIASHNIPEGISIAMPIYFATKNRKKAFLYTYISGLSEPLGALLAHLFLSRYLNSFVIGLLLSFIAGIMLHISFYKLIPTARKYKNNKLFIIFFVIGAIFMVLNDVIFS